MSKIVVKYGGSLLDDKNKQDILLQQIAQEWKAKRNQIVIVHGGGKEISRQMEQAGIPPVFVKGRRFTDGKTMAVVEKALQQLNDSIVQKLQSFHAAAKGYSGKENHWLKATAVKGLGQVGIPVHADPERLLPLLDASLIPVFYSVGENEDRQTLNINADDFAMPLAIAWGADQLIFLTDTGGVLDKSKHLIPRLNRQDADRLMKEETITGGMAVKIAACFEALLNGVGKVIIGETILSDVQGLRVVNGTTIVSEGPTPRQR